MTISSADSSDSMNRNNKLTKQPKQTMEPCADKPLRRTLTKQQSKIPRFHDFRLAQSEAHADTVTKPKPNWNNDQNIQTEILETDDNDSLTIAEEDEIVSSQMSGRMAAPLSQGKEEEERDRRRARRKGQSWKKRKRKHRDLGRQQHHNKKFRHICHFRRSSSDSLGMGTLGINPVADRTSPSHYQAVF